MAKSILEIKDLEAWSSNRQILHRVNFNVENKKILSIIGPRGSGKSTLLRCLNRLFEERVGQRVTGSVRFNGEEVYDKKTDHLKLRRQVSMLFAEPSTFSHLSIFENIALGLRINQEESGAIIGDAVEKALVRLDMWDQIKSNLHKTPEVLSLGEKQMICLARTLVLKPKVILMDEPTSVIGLQATMLFEQFIREHARKVAIVMTTSSRKQAARVSDRTAFLLDGELIEIGKTSDLFMNPQDNRTEDFITGRFG